MGEAFDRESRVVAGKIADLADFLRSAAGIAAAALLEVTYAGSVQCSLLQLVLSLSLTSASACKSLYGLILETFADQSSAPTFLKWQQNVLASGRVARSVGETAMHRKLALATALGFALCGQAWAGPLEDANAAYLRRDYATALQLFLALAEKGDPDSTRIR